MLGSYPISHRKPERLSESLSSAHECDPPLLFLRSQAHTDFCCGSIVFLCLQAASPDVHGISHCPCSSSPVQTRVRTSCPFLQSFLQALLYHSEAFQGSDTNPQESSYPSFSFQTIRHPGRIIPHRYLLLFLQYPGFSLR